MSPVVDSQLFPKIINTPLLGPGSAIILTYQLHPETDNMFISQPRLTALIQGGTQGDSHLFKFININLILNCY